MNSVASILADADQCVMCGLCLPHCPTFRETHDEAESPRGRIMLMQAFASGRLEGDAALTTHLDNCLACRACERMCPSRVPYGRLIEQSRALQLQQSQRTIAPLLGHLLEAVTEPGELPRKAQALRLYQKSGAQWLARNSGLLKGLGMAGLEQQLPEIPPQQPLAAHYPARGERRGVVALFTGCVGAVIDQPALHAAIRLLTRLGYEVEVPSSQQCCGSLHQHQGEAATAQHMARGNIAAFSRDYAAILITASGCGAHLSDYGRLYGTAGEPLAQKVRDISTFLCEIAWPEGMVPARLETTVALHTPCTLHNVLRQSSAPAQLLSRIPGLKLVELEGNPSCCGAAGSYQLTHPAMADTLRAPKVASLAASKATVLASSNFGCAHHLVTGMRQQGSDIEALHPVVLLERQLALAGW